MVCLSINLQLPKLLQQGLVEVGAHQSVAQPDLSRSLCLPVGLDVRECAGGWMVSRHQLAPPKRLPLLLFLTGSSVSVALVV